MQQYVITVTGAGISSESGISRDAADLSVDYLLSTGRVESIGSLKQPRL